MKENLSRRDFIGMLGLGALAGCATTSRNFTDEAILRQMAYFSTRPGEIPIFEYSGFVVKARAITARQGKFLQGDLYYSDDFVRSCGIGRGIDLVMTNSFGHKEEFILETKDKNEIKSFVDSLRLKKKAGEEVRFVYGDVSGGACYYRDHIEPAGSILTSDLRMPTMRDKVHAVGFDLNTLVFDRNLEIGLGKSSASYVDPLTRGD